MSNRSITDDSAWEDVRQQWHLREDTIYLNHGSFGPPPEPVRTARRGWIDELDRQPMDFFIRISAPALQSARQTLASFVGTQPENLVLVENSTSAMNILADSLPLAVDDEVLLTDHEYGAVTRIWQRACRRAGANPPTIARLPIPVDSSQAIVGAILNAANDKTRLIVISHITSATAIILPVAEICRQAKQRGIEVCIDGPHALAQIPLHIDRLDCSYYTASCHKWLSAPFGSGFLYVAPPKQHHIQPQQLSWGRLPPATADRWDDEFVWSGTRDPSSYLGIAAAIRFLEAVGIEKFRQRTHYLAGYARDRLLRLPGASVITPDDAAWYGSMSLVRLPDGDCMDLQRRLWENHHLEVPIIDFGGRRYVRVSCHLYNRQQDIETLAHALETEL